MKIALAQINTTVGDFAANESKILAAYRRGVAEGAELVVLPELATAGYPPRDLLLRPDFILGNEAVLERVALATGSVGLLVGFVGRNAQLQMDANLLMFEEVFVPLLREAKARDLVYRVEQCPMPGWTTKDNWHNNIAYTPGTWIALHRICE